MRSEHPLPGNYAVARQGLKRKAPATSTARTSFSREDIIEALQRWTRQFGEPPRGTDLEPARARRMGQQWRADRFEADSWPSAKMITGQFGSLNAALDAAGIPYRRRLTPGVANLSGPEAVLDAIRQWVRRYGAVPMLADWDPTRARRLGQDWRIARYYQGNWPSTGGVIARFGSMSAAITAAGLPPRGQGHHGHTQLAENLQARHATAQMLHVETDTEATELAEALRDLATARRAHDPVAMHTALIDVAGIALAWAEHAGSDPAA